MTDSFDPYHRWLSIPKDEHPPSHYRLLGLGQFEDDDDVIDSAADRQMSHVRTFQTGQHSDLSQSLLNEISVARGCLLNTERKAAYDAELRATMSAQVAPLQPDTVVATPQASESLFRHSDKPSSRSGESRKKGKNPVVEFAKIVGGGIGGIVIAICILWYGLEMDPFSLFGNQSKEVSQVREPMDEAKPHPTSRPSSPVAASKDGNKVSSSTPVDVVNDSGPQDDTNESRIGQTEFGPSTQTRLELLSRIDLDKHVLYGTWYRDGDGIGCRAKKTSGPMSSIEFPLAPSIPYVLEIDLSRTSEFRNGLIMRMPGQGDASFQISIDSASKTQPASAIVRRNGLKFFFIARRDGRVFEKAELQRVRCEIKSTGIDVSVNGRNLLSWNGDLSALRSDRFPTIGKPRPPQSLTLGIGREAAFKITRMELIYPDKVD